MIRYAIARKDKTEKLLACLQICVEGKAFLHYIRWKGGNEGERQTTIFKILAANI